MKCLKRETAMLRTGLVIWLLVSGIVHGDGFDRLTNADLEKLIKSPDVQEHTELASAHLGPTGPRVGGMSGLLLVVKTRDGNLAKMELQLGFQKIGVIRAPMLLIDRFVTFKAGSDQTIIAQGTKLQLFGGVRLNLDLGQVIPSSLPGDLEMVGAIPGDAAGPTLKLHAIDSTKLFHVNKLPPQPDKPKKFVMGEQFEPRYFTGTYKLFDDGRRSGSLTLEADEAAGTVCGSFYSDKDGRKYEVTGKLGQVRHQVNFMISFPQSKQQYQGFMFTGDGQAIAGTCKYQDRETGFYAIRSEGDGR